MKQADLMREVEGVIEARLANGEPAPMGWLVEAVLAGHREALGSDFAALCCREHVHATVRAVLRARKGSEEDIEPRQGDLFPGYKRIQRSYTIERDRDQVVVRLEDMTAAEVRGKASELRAFAQGAWDHAAELDEYARAREAA